MRRVVLLVLIVVLSLTSKASHFVGGEITWECISDATSIDFGKYIFQMKVYRDCTGIPFSSATAGGFETLVVHDNPLVPTIDCFWDNTLDISPTGINGGALGTLDFCYDCSNYGSAPGGSQLGKVIHQHTYRSLPTDLGGNLAIPPVSGWHFTWGTSARNAANNMTSAGAWLLRAIMYPYTKNSSVIPYVYEDAFPCFDSSPVFKEEAKTVLCLDVPFSYSHLAFDPDFDSLAYYWAYPLQGNSGTYNTLAPLADSMSYLNLSNGGVYPFSVNNQLPSSPLGPLNLNQNTGEISFIASGLQGVFLTCVKVTTVKCFQVISEVFREVQVVLTNCGMLPNGNPNSPPTFSMPIGTQTWYSYINSAGLPSFYTTIVAGELVEFDVNAQDIDMQNLSLEIEGSQIDLALALSNPAAFNILSSNPGDITGRFSWLSNCDHLELDSCAGRPNQEFNFNLKAYDDFCPANGTTIANLTINIVPPTPDFRCVAVDSVGDVDLSWYYPTSLINAVIAYDVYFSKNKNGPYSNIGSVSYPDSTFMHNGSDAHLSSSFYYLIAQGVCINSINNDIDSVSDTLQTMFLEATAINSVPIVANLVWNTLRKNNDPATQIFYQYNLESSSDLYSLYYKYTDSIGFNLLSQLPDTISQKRSDYCSYDPEFYIELPDDRGCISRSNVATTHLGDDTDPDLPIIKDVSVNNNGEAVISWEPSVGAEKYAIYIWNELDGWIPIDTVLNAFSYTYLGSFANQQFELFSIRGLDSCDNQSLASADLNMEHNSMYLEMEIEACDHTVDLKWNEYINMHNGFSHYRVFVEETDLNGIVSNIEYRTLDYTFLVENIIDGYNYEVFVNAYNQDSSYIARSNTLYFIPDLPKKPSYNYIEYASVNHDNGFVDINCFVDNQAIINHYDIFSSLVSNNSFSKIAEIPFTGSTSIFYTDQTINTTEESYRYKIYPVDTCGVRLSVPSYNDILFIHDTSFAQNIVLETIINLDYGSSIPVGVPYTEDLEAWGNGGALERQYTNTITFNEYEKWLGGVETYDLYRSVDGGMTYSPFSIYTWNRVIKPEEPLMYIDIVTNFGRDNGRICYYIHAKEGGNTPFLPVLEGSYSNISCVSQTPVIFIPSVFTPNGDEHNEVFSPVSFFVDENGYSFSIYNRSGLKLFSTNDPKKGWDGTYLGKQVQNGSYIYHLQFINGLGEQREKTDVITLIR